MTLWLSNLAAYSVQLAALVGTGAVIVALLRINTPGATLRFWQALFASSLAWPLYQLWASADASGLASAGLFSSVFSTGPLWNAASSGGADMRAGIAAMNSRVTLIVVAVLAAGAVLRLAWLGIGLVKLRAIRAASEPAHALSPIATTLQRELGATADVRFSDAIDSPATIGARHAMVLLPRRVGELPLTVARAVLCHELIHVRRRDWLPAFVEEMWCALLWFHPAARALASRLSLARETLVDEATIAHTRDRRAYAAALLEFSTAGPRLVGTTPLVGRRHLARRIALIAQELPMTRSSLALRLAVAASVVCIATLAATSNVPINATLHAQAEKVYKPGADEGVTLPQLVKEVKPDYTPEAMQAKIQGTLWLRAVVLASGDVGDVTVISSLDEEHGLDQQAINAARQWTFRPGTKDGNPVPVEVTIEFRFTLKK